MPDTEDYKVDGLSGRVRLLVILNAAEDAGLCPIAITPVHTLAYLSNVLAPVWELRTLDGKVLKRHGGPFYPALQRELDHMVGSGLVRISSLGHSQDELGRWKLVGRYDLNRNLSDSILDLVHTFKDEHKASVFVRELAFALASLSEDEFDTALMADATYADPMIDVGGVVDFDEWKRINFAANAANFFSQVMPKGSSATAGEKIHLYIRHLHYRLKKPA